MNSLKCKEKLASHIRNRNAIKQMYQEKDIQMIQQTPQLLSEMKEKSLSIEKQILYNLMKEQLEKEGYSEFRYVGDGCQGFVLLAKEHKSNKRFAIKGFSISNSNGSINQEIEKYAKQEMDMLQRCRNLPNVSNLIRKIKNGQNFIFLILTECQGTLSQLIQSIPGYKLNELSAIKYSKDIAEGLYYIHQQGCIVNDLKLENILIDFNGNAVVSDFGFAQALPTSSGYSIDKYMGNMYYQAPECCDDPTYFQIYIDEYKKINIQPNKNPSIRSEAFSFGYLIYTMIQGAKNLAFKKHLPLEYDQTFQSFKYKKELRGIIDGLTKFAPHKRTQIEDVLNEMDLELQQEILSNNQK